MADYAASRQDPGRPRTRTVPVAVTPEGFWCCPSPAALHRSLKNPHPHPHHGKPKPPPDAPPAVSQEETKRPASSDADAPRQEPATGVAEAEAEVEPERRRGVRVGFGEPETSDLTVVLSGEEGVRVSVSAHRDFLAQKSSFFADKLAAGRRRSPAAPPSCVEITDCEDAEIYVETIGLMYCSAEAKHKLVHHNVSRVLRIMKVAEALGFYTCVESCLDYLEAVPWVGEEEDDVVASVRRLQSKAYGVSSLLRRVSSDSVSSCSGTLGRIIEMVLKSRDDKGRREMKNLVLNLLKENNLSTTGLADICAETLYSSCRNCLDRLLELFKEASDSDFSGTVTRQITLEADNLLWLAEILADRRVSDDFVVMWAGQSELAALHAKLPVASRHSVSCITARLFVGIGRGEMLPSKDVRFLLLRVWLQPLIDDYTWLQCSCRSFDRKLVEEGIGQTILTLPLEDQQAILLSWLGRFLKSGDSCPNLQRAFEVWWRRTFIRPYVEQQRGNASQSNRTSSITDVEQQ